MKYRGIRFCLMLFAFMSVFSFLLPAQADSSYISIREMREAVPSTWTENLKGGKENFDCTIDAAVVVPEVDFFPVQAVTYPGKKMLKDSSFQVVEDTERGIFVKSVPDEKTDNSGSSGIVKMFEDSLSDETIARADEKARKIFLDMDMLNDMDLERLGITELREEDSAYQEFYVNYCPVYDGIGYLKYPSPMYDVKGYVEQPCNIAYAFWVENSEYKGAGVYVPKLNEKLVSDVPLISFDKIQETIRQHIYEGYVQSVCEIRLGYICVNDPEHPGENFYLTPGWVVCGVMNSRPDLPFHPENYYPEQRYTGSQLIIDAQKGEIIDINSRNKETFEAHILTWNDVR